MDAPELTASDILAKLKMLESHYGSRNDEFSEMRDFYKGEEEQHWPTLPARSTQEKQIHNYGHAIAEKFVEFQIGDMPDWMVIANSTKQADKTAADKSEKILYALQTANRGHSVLRKIVWNKVICGLGVAKVTFDKKRGVVRYASCIPDYFYPVSLSSDYDWEFQYTLHARVGTMEEATQLYPEFAEAFEADSDDQSDIPKEERKVKYVEYCDSKYIALVVGGQLVIPVTPHNYGFNPYIPFPNNPQPGEITGQSELKQIKDLVISYNKLMSKTQDIINANANPPFILEGTGIKDLKSLPKAGEGGAIPIRPGGRVYYPAWSGIPASVTEQAERYLRAIKEISGMTDAAFAVIKANIYTGQGLEQQLQPIIQKIKSRRVDFDIGLQKLNEYLLKLTEKFAKSKVILPTGYENIDKSQIVEFKGADIKGHYNVKTIWGGVLPKENIAVARFEMDRYREGTQSLETTMEKLGDKSPLDEKEKIKAELDEGMKPNEQAKLEKSAAEAAKGEAALMQAEQGATEAEGTPPGTQTATVPPGAEEGGEV